MSHKPELPGRILHSADDLPEDFTFRWVETGDLRPLHAACFSSQTFEQFRNSARQLLKRQRDGRCFWLLLSESIDIIGTGQLILYPHGNELANLFVIPDWRNKGLGTAIIGVLTTAARYLELSNLELGVAENNIKAQALYRRLGFSEDRRFTSPGGKPVLIFRKDL